MQSNLELYAAIRCNREKLDACKQHCFNPLPPLFLGAMLTCSVCKAYMSAVEANQYARGFEAAGGDPNLIIAGFR